MSFIKSPMTEPNVTLTLLHTNDIHSHFEEACRIAGYFADVRSCINPDKLIVVDCGDFLDRARMETEGTNGDVNRAVVESMGYDAVLLGNNEGLSYTPVELDRLFTGMSVPVVCANMVRNESKLPPSWMIPSMIIERSGIRIGFIGLTAPFNDYYDLLGWDASDPMDTLQTEAARLRPEVDVLIVLSHLGLRNDEKIAATIEGIDLILGGHTHHLLEVPLQVGQTAICAAGKFGFYVGHLELEFGVDNKLIRVTGGCRSTDDFPHHVELDNLIEAYRKQARQKMNRQIAELTEPLHTQHNRESPLPTLLACGIRHLTGAEIGLVNAGQLLKGLPIGKVTEETIHSICPSPINACTIKLSGRLIVRTLEESLLPEFQDLSIRGFGFRGNVLGMLCLDGLEVRVDLDQAPYRRIVEVKVNGAILDEDKIYSVGTLDMFTFGVGYLGLKSGHDVQYFLPEFIRDVLSDALNDEQWIKDCKVPRWRFEGHL
ncbi:bifunctional UDP-sugar hydrolase/5'-nucleotidase [Cohnella sp. WQ 127256]|uniref:bifunctional metallophosphatase/5'-nucleotidase n=1 Tax=Cohnella sp. WQ 127256 TaxID=2938790 RepID=UPI002117CA78|nr:bifunctional UDP-sugar hydrolase/5'-nucleotidase [Cohnella sp. WQ 127256]